VQDELRVRSNFEQGLKSSANSKVEEGFCLEEREAESDYVDSAKNPLWQQIAVEADSTQGAR
jgi:hypothetical protein